MSESGHLYPPVEMDSLPAESPVIGKSHVSHKLARRDYAIGICLLLLVVFLWTASNFVTQVRLDHHWSLQVLIIIAVLASRTYLSEDTGNLSCLCHSIFDARRGSLTVVRHSITYLTTSTFSLYLLPFLIKSYIRRRYHGGSDQTVGLG
jgi:solute carrier family 35 protein F5